jgi:phosphatidate cytidylyltransferase
MLRTRLWVGALLVVVAGGGLVVDQWFAPYYPFLFVLVLGLALAGGGELIRLLSAVGRPNAWLCYAGLALVIAANWPAHLPTMAYFGVSPWAWIAGAFALFVLLAFVVEMITIEEPGTAVLRIALAVWLVAYLGLLPSFLAQVRWLGATSADGLMALLLAIFVPKCGDIGAYCTGRLIGCHPMTPLLSPKKTWEGAAGGLLLAVAVALALDRLGPARMLHHDLTLEVSFGVIMAVAGMFGDLAESLIKRDVRQKDASQVVPGFGGVLDVVDALLFSGPVAYLWFTIAI